MDWSWWSLDLADTVAGSESFRLPRVGLHKHYGVCTQREKRNYSSEFSALQAYEQRCISS